ncbi:MAG: hypothetical protein M3R04_02330 [bacterium]|nr:hypothetical protein [bacterium]
MTSIVDKDVYISDLLDRLADHRHPEVDSRGSDQTISWYACRDAETLSDPELLRFLTAAAKAARTSPELTNVGFCLGNLAKNTGSIDALSLLILLAEREKRYWPKSQLLTYITLAAVPESLRDRLLSLAHASLTHKNDKVRRSAADLTGHLRDSRSVPLLLDLLDSCIERYEIANLIGALGKCGDFSLVDSLLPFTNSSAQDVAWVATYNIGELGKAEATPVLARILLGSQNAKHCAMWRLHEHGDERAVDEVVERCRLLFQKPNKSVWADGGTDVVLGLEYLSRFAPDPRVEGLFRDIRLRLWRKLKADEKARLVKNVSQFADLPTE